MQGRHSPIKDPITQRRSGRLRRRRVTRAPDARSADAASASAHSSTAAGLPDHAATIPAGRTRRQGQSVLQGARASAAAQPGPPGTGFQPPARDRHAHPERCQPASARSERKSPNTWPRSRGSTASGTGPGKATSRSKTNWARPTSRSAPTPRSAATRCWSTARSASAGPPGSLTTRHRMTRHRSPAPVPERGAAPASAAAEPLPGTQISSHHDDGIRRLQALHPVRPAGTVQSVPETEQ